MTEQQIQKKIITYLENEHNAYIVKVIAASRAGVPDILCCINGMFVAIEVKTPETMKNVSKLQQYNIDKIKATTGIAFVACSVEQVTEALNDSL